MLYHIDQVVSFSAGDTDPPGRALVQLPCSRQNPNPLPNETALLLLRYFCSTVTLTILPVKALAPCL